jgi:hypothetical protein
MRADASHSLVTNGTDHHFGAESLDERLHLGAVVHGIEPQSPNLVANAMLYLLAPLSNVLHRRPLSSMSAVLFHRPDRR